MTEWIAPCPFCGGEGRLDDVWGYSVACHNPDCLTGGPMSLDGEAEAIAAWNRMAAAMKLAKAAHDNQGVRTRMTDDELIRQMVDMSRVLQTDRQCMVKVLQLVREHDAKHRPPETEKPRRVPVQIVVGPGGIFALANDGRIYIGENKAAFEWHGRLPDLPQD